MMDPDQMAPLWSFVISLIRVHRLLSILKRWFCCVDLLFNVLPIVCGCSVFVFVLVCITLCPF